MRKKLKSWRNSNWDTLNLWKKWNFLKFLTYLSFDKPKKIFNKKTIKSFKTYILTNTSFDRTKYMTILKYWKYSNCDQTQNLTKPKMWQNFKYRGGGECWQNLNCNNNIIVNKLKLLRNSKSAKPFVTKHKIWQNSHCDSKIKWDQNQIKTWQNLNCDNTPI